MFCQLRLVSCQASASIFLSALLTTLRAHAHTHTKAETSASCYKHSVFVVILAACCVPARFRSKPTVFEVPLMFGAVLAPTGT